MENGQEPTRERRIVWPILAIIAARLLLDFAVFAFRLGDDSGQYSLTAIIRLALTASILVPLAALIGMRSRLALYALAPAAAICLGNAGFFLGAHLVTHRLGQRLYRVKLSYGSTLAEVFQGADALHFGAELLFWGSLMGVLLMPNVRAVFTHRPFR